MASQPKKFLSVDEYLEIERHSEFRSAYVKGELFPREAATGDHALICLNTGAEIRDALRKTEAPSCRAFDSSAMIYQPGPDKPVYADITVVCGKPEYRDAHNDVILNPQLVVEVLSSSTRNYDRGDKFEGYSSVTSLIEYVVIEQTTVLVELRTRRGDNWIIAKQKDLESHIRLASLEISIPLRSIYEGVSWLRTPGA